MQRGRARRNCNGVSGSNIFRKAAFEFSNAGSLTYPAAPEHFNNCIFLSPAKGRSSDRNRHLYCVTHAISATKTGLTSSRQRINFRRPSSR